jgi:hypothetical protein
VVTIDSFDSHVLLAVIGYIKNGKIMFERHRTITPEYLQIIYKACDYFLLDVYPDVVDMKILSTVPVVTNTTIYGHIRSPQLDTKQFHGCFFSSVQLDSHTLDVSFDACVFRNCLFRGASFDRSSSFRNCLFSDCDMTTTNLPSSLDCRFDTCLLSEAGLFRGAVLANTVFRDCSMRGFQANVPGVVHPRNTFTSCDLSGATLRGLDHCAEMGCVFSYATVDNRNCLPSTHFLPTTACPSLIRLF